MALPNQTRRLMALAVAAAALLATFFFLVRPRLLRWGASESEVRWVAVRRRHRLRPDRLGGQGHALLVLLDSGRAHGFATRQVGTPPWAPYDGSWSFVLEPIDGRTTRFLVRGAAAGKRSIAGSLFDHVIFDPVQFVMERKMMEGMKLRAEGGHPAADADVAQVVLWTIALGLMIASAVLVFRRAACRICGPTG